MQRATPPGRGRWHLWRRSWPRGCGGLVTASSFSLTDVLNACASTRRPAVMSVVAVPASLRLCPTDSGAGRRSRMMGAPGGVLATRRLPHSRPGGSLARSAKNTKSSGSRLSLFHIDTLIARRSTLKRASAASPSCESACRIGFRQIKHRAAHKLVRLDLARGRPDRRARPWSRMVSSSG
jgi:hypothetical protein